MFSKHLDHDVEKDEVIQIFHITGKHSHMWLVGCELRLCKTILCIWITFLVYMTLVNWSSYLLVCHLLVVSSDKRGIVTTAMTCSPYDFHSHFQRITSLLLCRHATVPTARSVNRIKDPSKKNNLWLRELLNRVLLCASAFCWVSQLLAFQLGLRRGAGKQDGSALSWMENWLDVQSLDRQGGVAGPCARCHLLHGRGDTLVPLGCRQQSEQHIELRAHMDAILHCKTTSQLWQKLPVCKRFVE